MKILLFNLGSVKKRIIDWDIKGYRPIFENDVILWGPIPDSNFEFDGKEIPIISFFEQTEFKTVIDRLPAGWIPDIVTCDTSVLNFVPDIYLCPFKTILFTRDAWADTIFNRRLVEFFDFISHSVIDISLYQFFKVDMLPLASYPVSLPDPGELFPVFEKRPIDVIAIANYDDSFYHDRHKTFYRLSEANNSHIKIKYFKGLEREEIHEYYKRSKIVIDWAHTLSNRSYEAALNGCLLFSHEDNVAMKLFWKPGEEYVEYNDENLYELICYYLKKPQEAKRITGNTAVRIRTTPLGFGHYTLENVRQASAINTDIDGRIERIKNLNPGDYYSMTATPLLYNYRYETDFPSDWRKVYYKRIDMALSSFENNIDKIAPLIEAARVSFLMKDFNLSEKYLGELEIIIPEYGWTYYLKGRIKAANKDFVQALSFAGKAIKYGLEKPEYLKKYILPVIEKGNSCDGRRITDYLWESIYKHGNEYQVKALLNLSFDLSGDICQLLDQPVKASEAYYQAIKIIPLPALISKEAPLLINSNQYDKLLEITSEGVKDSPYNSITVLYKVYAMLHFNRKSTASGILYQHRKALKSFVGIRRIIFVRFFFMLLIFMQLFSRDIAKKIIIRLISILNK